MIIQCEQCRTKFKLDDSKVADKSIKVRCARCRHVFTVAGIHVVPEISPSIEQNAPVFQIEEDLVHTAAPAHDSAFSFEADTLPDDESFDHSSLLDTFSFEEDEESAEPESQHSADNVFDFSHSSAGSAATNDQEIIRKDSDTFDFGAFDFSEESGEAAKPETKAHALDFVDHSVKQG